MLEKAEKSAQLAAAKAAEKAATVEAEAGGAIYIAFHCFTTVLRLFATVL